MRAGSDMPHASRVYAPRTDTVKHTHRSVEKRRARLMQEGIIFSENGHCTSDTNTHTARGAFPESIISQLWSQFPMNSIGKRRNLRP